MRTASGAPVWALSIPGRPQSRRDGNRAVRSGSPRHPPLNSRSLPNSAGVGRTGVFITLSIVLERMRYEGVVDIFQTVKMLRTQRPAMVQMEVRAGREAAAGPHAGAGPDLCFLPCEMSTATLHSLGACAWKVLSPSCFGLPQE